MANGVRANGTHHAKTAAISMDGPSMDQQIVHADSQFPRSDAPSLVLEHPNADEVQQQYLANSESWRAPLSVDAYLRREVHLANSGIAQNAGITFWVLKDASFSVKGVLAGCETLKKRAFVNRNGVVDEVIAHGVGSVFTPTEFRGRGYGSRMMRELSKQLRTWQTDEAPCLFSVLFSDIGKSRPANSIRGSIRRRLSLRLDNTHIFRPKLTRKKTYYAKSGWKPYPSSHVCLKADASAAAEDFSLPVAKPLYEDQLESLCTIDEALLHRAMSQETNGTFVALIPDHKTMLWHHAREEFVSNELQGRRPMVKGALTHTSSGRVWAIWTRVWQNEDPMQSKGNKLYILRIAVEGNSEMPDRLDESEDHVAGIASVLKYAQKEAQEWNMEGVEVWNPHPRTFKACQRLDVDAKVVDRDSDSITSLNWFGEPGTAVTWLDNEKYGWC